RTPKRAPRAGASLLSSERVDQIEIVDAQVHIWEKNHPGRPWTAYQEAVKGPLGPAAVAGYTECEMTAADMLRAMEKVGVDAAVVVPPGIIYGFDCSYGFEAAATHPNRFGV